MSPRIAPLTLSTASDTTRPLLEGLKKALGMVPQLYATIGHAPGALKGLLAFGDALDQQGKLSRREVELVSLHASELNGCGYCVAAHGALAGRAGLSPEEITAARNGHSSNLREAAILALTRRVTRTGGAQAGTELAAAREAGLTDGEIVEVLAHAALKFFTNSVALVAQTEVDFPKQPKLPQP